MYIHLTRWTKEWMYPRW